MLLYRSFMAALGALALTGGLAPMALATGNATFFLTTKSDKAIITMSLSNPGDGILTIVAKASGETIARLNDKKNGTYTGYERAELAPSTDYALILSGFRGACRDQLVLSSHGETVRFTLAAAGPDATIGARILGDTDLLAISPTRHALTLSSLK